MFSTFVIVNILRYNYTIRMFIFAYLIYFFLEITGMRASQAKGRVSQEWPFCLRPRSGLALAMLTSLHINCRAA